MTAIIQTSDTPSYGKFRFTYRFDGADWSFEIPALSLEEAKERVKVLAFARPESEIPIDAAGGAPPRRRPHNWFRNAIRSS